MEESCNDTSQNTAACHKKNEELDTSKKHRDSGILITLENQSVLPISKDFDGLEGSKPQNNGGFVHDQSDEEDESESVHRHQYGRISINLKTIRHHLLSIFQQFSNNLLIIC